MAFFKKIFNKKESSGSNFHSLKVKAVNKITADTSVITLEIPSDLQKEFNFIPGQYLTGKFKTKSGELNRSYSICSSSNVKSEIQIAAKKIDGGKVSSYINDELEAGVSIDFMKPQGNFLLDTSAKKVTAICAGSGITPIMAMIRGVESDGGEMDLFYGNRTESEIIFSKEILNSSDKIKTNIFLSKEAKEGFVEGRITPKTLEDKIDLNSDFFYLCGPEGLIFSTKDYLKEKGVSDNRIKFELFTAPVSVEEKKIKTKLKKVQVTVTLNGDTKEIEMDAKRNILDSLQTNGIDAPFSCKGAVCCTCKAKVLEGSAEMKMNMALTDSEIAEGYILTCQSIPTTESIKLTYDE